MRSGTLEENQHGNNMEIDNLAKLISEAARLSFTETRERLGDDQIIGYCILSHDTADSCFPIIGTKGALDNYEYGPDEEFIFSPDEWDEFDNGPAFDMVNSEMAKLYNAGDYEVDENWHVKFRELVFEANVRGLEILIKDGFFGSEEDRNSIFIIFCLSDSETFETHVPKWVRRLNTEEVSRKFEFWHNENP